MANLPNNRHHRHSIRLQHYDYTQTGAYFVTLCTHNRECLFGEIVNNEMQLNDLGRIAKQCWIAIPQHFPHAALDEFVIMPNHMHGIVILNNGERHAVGARHAVPLQSHFGQPTPGSLPTLIRSYKSAVTKRINEMRGTPNGHLWQRNYYEHIIRNDESLTRIREYIRAKKMKP